VRPLVALPSRRTETASSWRVPAVAVGRTYLDAIVRAGGQPVVLPPIDETITDLAHVLARFDAVVLPGGPDVDPARYGAAERHPTVRGVDASHDELDLALARTAVELGMPLLAICRGHQVLNVALGGTLVQHIGDVTEMEHLWVHHEVELHADGLTADAMGTRRPTGHSVHHQAIDRLGEGLVATGFAHDGTIEAVELPGRWVIGVQWHPEDTADDDPEQQRLFGAVVSAARASRS
jgi:putative glutamine amidotransferase